MKGGGRSRLQQVAAVVTAGLTVPAVAAVASAAPDGDSRARSSRTGSTAEGSARPEGERIYLRDCAVCHGADGEGTRRGPSLVGIGTASVDFQLSTDRMPIGAPGEGLQRTPPDYGDEQIAAVVDHLRPVVGLTPGVPTDLDPSSGDLAAGGSLYRTHCAACHGTAGVGGALVFSDTNAPDLAGLTPVQVAEAMSTGPGTMPAFTPDPLSDSETEDVVAYVEELDRGDNPGGFGLWRTGPVPEGAVGWFVGLGSALLSAGWIGARIQSRAT